MDLSAGPKRDWDAGPDSRRSRSGAQVWQAGFLDGKCFSSASLFAPRPGLDRTDSNEPSGGPARRPARSGQGARVAAATLRSPGALGACPTTPTSAERSQIAGDAERASLGRGRGPRKSCASVRAVRPVPFRSILPSDPEAAHLGPEGRPADAEELRGPHEVSPRPPQGLEDRLLGGEVQHGPVDRARLPGEEIL